MHLVTRQTVRHYLPDLPSCFDRIGPVMQADYIRVNVLARYSGIWMDSDNIVMNGLDSLFSRLDTLDGFLVRDVSGRLCNALIGANAGTGYITAWKDGIDKVLHDSGGRVVDHDIGANVLDILGDPSSQRMDVLSGPATVYPVYWDRCVKEFIQSPYEHYKTIIREDQDCVFLIHTVYQALENMSERAIMSRSYPLNYFINESIRRAEESNALRRDRDRLL